jgi:hypothetical protein
MATEAPVNAAASSKPKLGRSPAYPFIPMEKALSQAKALYDREGRYSVPMASAFKAWGYGEKSSGGRQTLAALKYFGLIEVEGEGDKRKIRVSERALRIILDEREDQTERRRLIRELALLPPIHQQLMEKFQQGLPSDATVRHYLVFEARYNEEGAAELLAEFKETAGFAGLFQPPGDIDTSSAAEDGSGNRSQDQQHTDDSIASGRGSKLDTKARRDRTPAKAGMKEDVFTLAEGDVVFQWPERLSEASYDDLQAWTELLLRKIKRNVVSEPGDRGEPAPDPVNPLS